jgi:hypothetical protein
MLYDVDKIFWNICVGQLEGVHDGGLLRGVAYIYH